MNFPKYFPITFTVRAYPTNPIGITQFLNILFNHPFTYIRLFGKHGYSSTGKGS